MLIHIAIEIGLAIATFFAGNPFWELRKRAKFLRQVIYNEPFLESFISRQMLANPSPLIAPFVEKNEIGWFLNIKCVMDADRTSQRRPAIFFALVLLSIFAASYFLGIPYLAINLVIFALLAFGSISQSAQTNALQHVLAIAIILDKWRLENPLQCEEWLEKAWSLRFLYKAVKNAR